jgi:hypothetical protein
MPRLQHCCCFYFLEFKYGKRQKEAVSVLSEGKNRVGVDTVFLNKSK